MNAFKSFFQPFEFEKKSNYFMSNIKIPYFIVILYTVELTNLKRLTNQTKPNRTQSN